MATDELELRFPVGRLVQGSLYKGSNTDQQGQVKLIKNGDKKGQELWTFFFAVAIPKNAGEAAWWQTTWGAQILALAQRGWSQGQTTNPIFSWKIVDGDSAQLDQGNPPRAPNTREGFPGHWVVKFSYPAAPSVYKMGPQGAVPFPEADAIKLGDWVEVFGSVKSNDNPQKPGIYLNHKMVCFAAFGQRIATGPDPRAAGFGQFGALPPGASMVPPAAMGGAPVPPALPGAPGLAAPGFPAPGLAAPGFPAPGYPATPQAGSTPAPPVVPAMSPPTPGGASLGVPARVMLPAAQGASYETLIAGGWTDATLVQHGLMAVPAPALPAAPAVPVVPHTAILQPPVPAAPPVSPARVMLPAAQGASYETLIAGGWTDATLVQHGLMAA